MPKKSIERFCNQSGMVTVNWFEKTKVLALGPNESLFCAKRVWNQRAEDISIDFENAYQDVAQQIVNNQIKLLNSEMQLAVTHMYLLWRTRYLHALNPVPDQFIQAPATGDNLTKDQQEILERKGYFYMRQDGTVPSRAMVGVLMQRDMDMALSNGADKMQWGIVKAQDGLEFLCSDISINQPLLPVSPSYCLVAGWSNGTATPFGIANINKSLILESKSYWFARNPAKCPIINRLNEHFQAPRPSYLSGTT